MRFELFTRDTPSRDAKIARSRISQDFGIKGENQKVNWADHFCLTELALQGYFAGSPQAVVVARRPPAQPVVGGLWISGIYLGMAGGFSACGDVRLGGGILWH